MKYDRDDYILCKSVLGILATINVTWSYVFLPLALEAHVGGNFSLQPFQDAPMAPSD